MPQLYLKTAGLLLIIFLGYICKKTGLLRASDARILSRIIMTFTLPSVIISNLNGLTIASDMAMAILFGIIANLFLTFIAFVLSKNKETDAKFVYLYCVPLFNVSSYALPLAQVFATKREIAALLMFNLPTTVFSYVVVPAIVGIVCAKEKKANFLFKSKVLLKNVPAMSSIIMILLCMTNIRLSDECISLIANLGAANTALAMLSIGLILEIPKVHILQNLKIVFIRFALVCILAIVVLADIINLGELKNIIILVLFAPMISGSPVMALEQGYKGANIAIALSCYLPLSVLCMSTLSVFLY